MARIAVLLLAVRVSVLSLLSLLRRRRRLRHRRRRGRRRGRWQRSPAAERPRPRRRWTGLHASQTARRRTCHRQRIDRKFERRRAAALQPRRHPAAVRAVAASRARAFRAAAPAAATAVVRRSPARARRDILRLSRSRIAYGDSRSDGEFASAHDRLIGVVIASVAGHAQQPCARAGTRTGTTAGRTWRRSRPASRVREPEDPSR